MQRNNGQIGKLVLVCITCVALVTLLALALQYFS
jgi:hypothetical protein